MGWRCEYPWAVVSPVEGNVFIIVCNDRPDNNSFSSEGISIKMEGSIKKLYARIYKLGNFLDYCNHLQNWLFRCGIGRFPQWSSTTSTFSDVCSYRSPSRLTVQHPHRPRSRDFGLKVGPTFKEVYTYGEVQNFFPEVMVCDSACERVQHYLKIPVPIGEGCWCLGTVPCS